MTTNPFIDWLILMLVLLAGFFLGYTCH